MAHKHRKQRPWHEYRYGLRHWLQHVRGTPHFHARKRRINALGEVIGEKVVVVSGPERVREFAHSSADAHATSSTPRTEAGVGPAGPEHGHRPRSTQPPRTPNSSSRRHRSRTPNRRRRQVVVGAGLVVIAAAVALGVSAAYSILKAKSQLENAKVEIDSVTQNPNQLLSAGARTHAAQTIAKVQADVEAANHTLSTSPGVAAMWVLPYLHTQRQALFGLISDIETTTSSGRQLLTSVNTLVAASHGTTISLPALKALHHQITVAYNNLSPLGHPSPGVFPLLPPLASAQTTLDHDLTRLTGLLGDGKQLTSYAAAFLGADGPRNYLLVAENNAEMRDQGAVLSFATMNVDNGTFNVSGTHSVGEVALRSPANVPMSPGTRVAFAGFNPTQIWQSADAPASFPWTGTDVQAMYAQATGQRVDGVIALDVPGLANLLSIVGPVQVAGVSQPITAANLAEITLHQLYQDVPSSANENSRRDVLASIAKAAVDKMKSEHVDIAAFANVLAKDAAGRHLLAWDSVPAYEATIRKFGASGAVDTQDPTRTFHLALENGSANKLDYYVDVKVSENVVITRTGDADVTTTVTGTNHTPTGVPPGYQYGPDGVNSHVPGQYVGLAYLWGPRGATQAGSVSESGLTLSHQTLELLPQQRGSVQFLTVIHHAVRNGQVHLVFVPQPRLQPEQLTIHMGSEGWNMTGPPVVHATLSKTMSWTWDASR